MRGRHVLKKSLDETDIKYIANKFGDIMNTLGVDFDDGNFQNTPLRWAKALADQFAPQTFNLTSFDDEPYGGLITLPHHQSWSMCPHHFERVMFQTTVSYVPRKDKVVGASKLARICDMFSKGCIMQETYTRAVADYIMEQLDPEGCGVDVVGRHNCMQCRGVETLSPLYTRELRGVYRNSEATRTEFLFDIGR